MFAFALATVLAVAHPLPHTDRTTPATTAKTFYAWHAHHEVTNDVPGVRLFFTPSLANAFDWVDAAQTCTHALILDYDPFGGDQIGIASELARDRANVPHYGKLTSAERACLAKIPY